MSLVLRRDGRGVGGGVAEDEMSGEVWGSREGGQGSGWGCLPHGVVAEDQMSGEGGWAGREDREGGGGCLPQQDRRGGGGKQLLQNRRWVVAPEQVGRGR